MEQGQWMVLGQDIIFLKGTEIVTETETEEEIETEIETETCRTLHFYKNGSMLDGVEPSHSEFILSHGQKVAVTACCVFRKGTKQP